MVGWDRFLGETVVSLDGGGLGKTFTLAPRIQEKKPSTKNSKNLNTEHMQFPNKENAP